MALILREMSTRYGRTPGGYIWALLEPLAAIILLSVGFSLLLRSPSLGSSFLLFYASGYIPLNVYNTTAMFVSRAISFSKPLLRYPSVTWIDAIAARFLLNALTSAMMAYVLFSIILATVENRVILEFLPMIFAMSLSALLGLGVGTMNCALVGLFPIWEMIWGIAMRPLFLASGVFYIYEDLPRVAQNILWWNPLLHISGLMRTGLYPTYQPVYINLVFVIFTILGPLVMGLILLHKHNKSILNA